MNQKTRRFTYYFGFALKSADLLARLLELSRRGRDVTDDLATPCGTYVRWR
jgi:hypothetical protein